MSDEEDNSKETNHKATLHVLPKPQVQEEVDPDVVETLEELLTEAKEGTVQTIAYVVNGEDSLGLGYAGFYNTSPWTILGALYNLIEKYNELLKEERLNW